MISVTLLPLAARVRLLDVPLERDEGEYAYMGQLMLQGIAPYKVAANMKLPGASAAYAAIMAIFGQTTVAIHLGLLIVNLAAIALLYLIGRKLFSPAAGFVAAASYAALSVSPGVLGIWAHATHFVVLPAMGGILLLLNWNESRRGHLLIWSGLLFGIAFLMKQPGILFTVFGAAFLVYNNWRGALRNLSMFASGAALPFGLLCFGLWRAGVFERFWFWTFTYARLYGSMRSFADGRTAFGLVFSQIAAENWTILALAVVGGVAAWKEPRRRAQALFLTAFLLFSFLAVCPGLYFREHYFVLLLPGVALFAGASVTLTEKYIASFMPWIAAAAIMFSLVLQSSFLFESTPLQISRRTFGINPFPEAIEIAAYIRAHSGPNDRIAIVGSEPEIYFYASRQSVTPYVYIYSMMEPHPFALKMQEEFIRDVEAANPEYLIGVNVNSSWLRQPSSPTRLSEWFPAFVENRYATVGVADIGRDQTTYRWDGDAAYYTPRFASTVVVFRRRERHL
jgi:Dolichyl-phosphate-mannose-protein mannosyltransferase